MKHLVARVLLGVMVAGGGLLLAFGPRPVSNAPEGRVRVQYWEKWTGLEGKQAQDVVDAFNATVGKEKGIWVDYVSMSQIDRKTLVSTAAGAPPDVVGLWDSQVMQFAALGALEPLGEYARRYGMTREKYKEVYFDGCLYQGEMYAVPSTVWCVGMLWNKELFGQKAGELRAAGLDPERAPRTIEELDRYAAVLDTWEVGAGGRKRLAVAGYVPMEPGSFINHYPIWFGGRVVNDEGTRMNLLSPEVVRAYEWFRGYSERLGRDEIAEFRSGFNSGGTNLYDTPQNPFLAGQIAMEQQGPWVTAFIEKLKPEGNRWGVPEEELRREREFGKVAVGMTRAEVEGILGMGAKGAGGMTRAPVGPEGSEVVRWAAGIKELYVTFVGGKVVGKAEKLLPAKVRQKYCMWGAAAFPSAVEGLENVTYAGMDVWVVPSTARHKKEAFEFIAFASRQDQIEKLSADHCNLTPLKAKSAWYEEEHPNPYVDVYEALAASPNARPLPKLVNWPFISDELRQVAERSYMLQAPTRVILENAQRRTQEDLDRELGVSAKGGGQ